MGHVDAAREQYIWRLYRISAADPSLYHLQIDSTVINLVTCTELIVQTYRSLVA